MVAAIALIAFWGLARLGEIFRETKAEGALLRRHTSFGASNVGDWAKLHLRKAKTAAPGEIQTIHLQSQPSVLDPVSALKRVMELARTTDRDDFLFKDGTGPMKRRVFVKIVEGVWGKASLSQWTGHSFRIGGASLRASLGFSASRIQRLGRWKSDCYLRYIKEDSKEGVKDTKEFLETIDLRRMKF